jgi:D-hexose-6-phosphate mutarotase
MEQYGFVPLSDEESNEIGFPSAINNFEKIFNQITNNIDKKIIMKKDIGETLNITDNEKTISFLNKYFIFKKIRSVNISNIKILNVKQEDIKEKESDDAEDDESKTTKNTEIKDSKLNIYIKKLNKKIRITKVKK